MNLKKWLLLFLAAMFSASVAFAQTEAPAGTTNAALRYWIAFADLQDSSADKPTQELLEKTAAGEAAWDEAKLGPILDKNEPAIQAMQRATNLPDCDWGLEYSIGPRASIAPIVRARVMARLNTLYGMRLAAKGESQKALDTWLAGIRFSRHMAEGGSLIFSLMAKMALVSNLNALRNGAQSGLLNGEERAQAAAVVSALPETGFDWANALSNEEAPLDVAIREMVQNPREYFQEMMGRPAPEGFRVPNASDIAAFHKLMAAAEAALRLPPAQAQERLRTLAGSIKLLHVFFQESTPNLLRINEARTQVQSGRNSVLQALSGK
jgi:hypothetical protein